MYLSRISMNQILNMIVLLISVLFVTETNATKNKRNNNHHNDNDIEMNDVTSLSELPIEKLLILRQSLKHEVPIETENYHKKISKLQNHNSDEDIDSGDNIRKTTGWGDEEEYGHHHSYHDNMLWTKSKGDIQSIFQTTVTVLAFLAFGGYLICLIITAVRGNNQQGQVVVQTMTSTMTTQNRKRRFINISARKNATLLGTSQNYTFDPEIHALCQIAEGYTKYHTITSQYETL